MIFSLSHVITSTIIFSLFQLAHIRWTPRYLLIAFEFFVAQHLLRKHFEIVAAERRHNRDQWTCIFCVQNGGDFSDFYKFWHVQQNVMRSYGWLQYDDLPLPEAQPHTILLTPLLLMDKCVNTRYGVCDRVIALSLSARTRRSHSCNFGHTVRRRRVYSMKCVDSENDK